MHRIIKFVLLPLLSVLPLVSAQGHELDIDRAYIETIIEEYILDNPEVILESVERYSQRIEDENSAARIAAYESELLYDPDTPVGGAADSELVIVEFFDYRCGYCRRSAATLAHIRGLGLYIKMIYKEFPILGPQSVLASTAALAAHRQGLYESFHHVLMTETRSFSETEIFFLAEAVGLDTDQLRKDMQDPKIAEYLERTARLADAIGVDGTPAFVINGVLYVGELDIEAMLHALEQ